MKLADEADLLDGKATRGWLGVRRENGALVTSSGHPLVGEVATRVPAGSVADVVAEVVAIEPTDFRAPARAGQLRCLDIQATHRSRFVAKGWFGKVNLENDTPASTAEVVFRFCLALALAAVVLLGLVSALLVG